MSNTFIFPTEVTDLEASSSEHIHVQNRMLVEHKSEKEVIRSIYEYRDRFESAGSCALQCQQDVFDFQYSLSQDHIHLGLDGRKYLFELLKVVTVRVIADLSNRNVMEYLDKDEIHIENQREQIKATTLTKGGKKVSKKVSSAYDFVLNLEKYTVLLSDLISDSHIGVAFPSGVPPVGMGMYACKTVTTLMSFPDYMKTSSMGPQRTALTHVFSHCNGLYSVDHETEHFLTRVLIDNSYTPATLADVFRTSHQLYPDNSAIKVLFSTLALIQIADNQNISLLPEFLEEIGKRIPFLCYDHMHVQLPQISNTHHSIRIGICVMVKMVLLRCFGENGVLLIDKSKKQSDNEQRRESLLKNKVEQDEEDEEEEDTKDQVEIITDVKKENTVSFTFLELFHILLGRSEDVYFTTRTQVLQCATELVQQQQIPLVCYRMALSVALNRLRDKTVSVRKHALILTVSLIEHFPTIYGLSILSISQAFDSKKTLGTSKEIELESLRTIIAQLEQTLAETRTTLEEQDMFGAAQTHSHRRQTVSVNPEVTKFKKEISKLDISLIEARAAFEIAESIVEKTHLEMQEMREYYQFAVLLKQCMDLCKELLNSIVLSDITEAIGLASAMLQANIDQSEGLVKMLLTLVCHKDPVIKTHAVEAVTARLVGKVSNAKDALGVVLNLMKYSGCESQSGVDATHRTTVTDALSMQEFLACLVRAGKLPSEVIRTCWELTTQYLGVERGQALLSTTDRANALLVLRMCAEGNPDLVLDGLASLSKLCSAAATKTDPYLVQQIAGMLGRLTPEQHSSITLKDRTFFAAFLVDALVHSNKFLICPGESSYFTDEATLRNEHLNDTREYKNYQSHLFRIKNGVTQITEEEKKYLVPFKPQHAFIATHRQKARVEAWFSMAAECIVAIEALSPTVARDLTFTVQALLSQAMHLQSIQASGNEEQANQILTLSKQRLSQNYLNDILHTMSEEPGFRPLHEDMGTLGYCTSFLLNNTPESWVPPPFLAFTQSHKDEALCFKKMFTPIIYLPSHVNPGYKNSGCTIQNYAVDVGIRSIPSSALLSRAMFIAGRAATYYLQQQHQEEKMMREYIMDGMKLLQNQRSDDMHDKKKPEDDDDATLEAELIAQHDLQIEQAKESTLYKMITDSSEELLAALLPTARRVLMYVGKFPSKSLQRAAAEALIRFMMLHAHLCADNLQLLISVLKSSTDEVQICNIIVGLADLAARHPNEVQRYNSYLYTCLHHSNPNVRVYAITTVSYLVLNDVHKTKEPAAGIAVCLVDQNPRIRDLAQLFFESLSRKTNAVYNPILNSIPDIISSLTHKYRVSSSNYDLIMKYLFNQSNMFFKEAECDILVEKLCRRFQSISQDMTGDIVLDELPETDVQETAQKPYRSLLETIDFDQQEFALNLEIELTQRGGMHCVCQLEENRRQCVCDIVRVNIQSIDISEALAIQQLRISNTRDILQEKGILSSQMTNEDKHQRYCQSIANVLPILGFGAGGLKKLMDLRQCYWNLLWDDQIYTKFKLTLKNLSKKLSGSKKDMKEDIVAFEAAMDEEHVKQKEDRSLLKKGKLHMQQGVLQKVRNNIANTNISAMQKLGNNASHSNNRSNSRSNTRSKKGEEEASKKKPAAKKTTAKKHVQSEDEDEAPRRRAGRAVKKEPVYTKDVDDDDDDDDDVESEASEEIEVPKKSARAPVKKEAAAAPKRQNKRKIVDSEDEEEESD